VPIQKEREVEATSKGRNEPVEENANDAEVTPQTVDPNAVPDAGTDQGGMKAEKNSAGEEWNESSRL
jgi:hypothetical protein